MLAHKQPMGPLPDWVAFATSGKKPIVLTAKTNAGGIHKGGKFKAFGEDRTGQFYAIWNSAGNAVWCHKGNFEDVSND